MRSTHCEGWSSTNEPRSSWRRSAQGWTLTEKMILGKWGSSRQGRSARARCNAQVWCNVWHCAMRCDDFGQHTMRKASCCAWAANIREVNAWRDDCNLKDNCDNRLWQARRQNAHEKNVCAVGVLITPLTSLTPVDCQEIKFPASEMSFIWNDFFEKKNTVHSMIKSPTSPSSTLTTSCSVATVMTKMDECIVAGT